MKNKVIKHTIVDGTGIISIIFPAFSIIVLTPFALLLFYLPFGLSKAIAIILLFLSIASPFISLNSFRKEDAKKKIAYGYRRSIKEALKTEYPEGVVYILQNVIQELDRFGLDFLPSKKQGTIMSFALNPVYDAATAALVKHLQTDSDIRGFPNRTNLKEAIYMAQTLSQEWHGFNYTEKSRSMAEIRAKIEAEDMWLDWNKITLPQGKIQAYWYSYTEEDHRNNQSFSNPTPQTPTPKPQPPSSTSQVLSFEEWVNQNPALQHFSEQEQREAYQRYLKSKGVNILSFDQWLTENPALQFFSEEEQLQAYQRYLDSLGGNS